MRLLPVTALATMAALCAVPLSCAENEDLRGSRSDEASLLTLQGHLMEQGKTFVVQRLRSPGRGSLQGRREM